MKSKIKEILKFLNEKYNQDSEDYSIINGAKPSVIRFDDETAISLWACGAIVCIKSGLYFIQEDDGHWFCNEYINKEDVDEDNTVSWKAMNYTTIGMQDSFSIGWTDSFVKALTDLKEYVKENGNPVYFVGTDIICCYTLFKYE